MSADLLKLLHNYSLEYFKGKGITFFPSLTLFKSYGILKLKNFSFSSNVPKGMAIKFQQSRNLKKRCDTLTLY